MAKLDDYKCYNDDWQRTNPDLVLHLPVEEPLSAEHVDHILVEKTHQGNLLAIWTMAVKPRALGVFYARSEDNGLTFSEPMMIDGPRGKPGQDCSFGFPVVSKNGRIYCFYNFSPGIGEGRINAILMCKYSDDDGRTWIGDNTQIPYRRSKFDHPDPKVLSRCIIWQKPIRDAQDRPVAPLTRSTSDFVVNGSDASHMGGTSPFLECRCEFVRFDNIDDEPEPLDVELTWLPDDENLVSVPVTFEPQASSGITFCQEPGLVLLPDKRLFTVMRTANGNIWYTISDDNGHSWRQTEVLRYRDDGNEVLNPIAPTPLFKLENGKFLIFLQNHDGFGHGGMGPLDLNARRPQFISVGEFRKDAHQPIWFSKPLLLFDTQRVGIYPFNLRWLSMYSSLTESNGQRTLWYSDRKMFALGKYITDDMIGHLAVPQ